MFGFNKEDVFNFMTKQNKQYDQKLNKMQVFYDEVFNKVGWIPCKEVDLRFRGQIVCK